MKNLFTFLAVVLLMASVFAQAPEKMSYQAVIRDDAGNLVTEQELGMQISILQGSDTGTEVYVETQTPTTNDNGLVSIEIGGGTVLSGDFTTIDWSNGPYFIKTETDPTGSTSYSITGTSELLSVPYALHANTAETVAGSIDYNDLTNTPDLSIYATEDYVDNEISKTLSLNIYGVQLQGDATFGFGFGANSRINFPKSASTSSFYVNFSVPHNYTPGDDITIRIVASGNSTGVVRFPSNAVSIASVTEGFIQGTGSASGLTMQTIDITEANKPIEFFGKIVSPVQDADINPGDAISFSFFRSPNHAEDTNTGALRIHGIQIIY